MRNFVLKGGMALMLVGNPLGLVAPAMAETDMLSLVIESYTIPSSDAGIELFVRNKRPQSMTGFNADRTVLYVHGSTQASETTFDLALDGMSWMDDLATHGWDVWLMDLRGYGRSTKPREMDQPPENNPPIAGTAEALRDVSAVIDHIRSRRGVPRISLIGWSRGAALIGLYASQNGGNVHRLILYSPNWVRTPLPSATAVAPLGAYEIWTVAQARERLQTGAPAEARDTLMPLKWFESWSDAVLATDPVGAVQTPPIVRTPSGTIQEARETWQAGKALYDPAQITAPTLVVRGEWDDLNTAANTRALFAKLVNAPIRRFVEIGEATHFMMLEKNRHQLFREVRLFLEEKYPM